MDRIKKTTNIDKNLIYYLIYYRHVSHTDGLHCRIENQVLKAATIFVNALSVSKRSTIKRTTFCSTSIELDGRRRKSALLSCAISIDTCVNSDNWFGHTINFLGILFQFERDKQNTHRVKY